MEDPRAAEGVEHLQGAARELLKAARSFLDVIEEVVEDPDRLTGAASGLADVVRNGLGRREAPWQHAAWQDDEPSERAADAADDATSDDDPFGDAWHDQGWSAGARPAGARSAGSADTAEDPVQDVDEPDVEEPPDEPAPARRPGRTAVGATTPRTSRVRRIAVD